MIHYYTAKRKRRGYVLSLVERDSEGKIVHKRFVVAKRRAQIPNAYRELVEIWELSKDSTLWG